MVSLDRLPELLLKHLLLAQAARRQVIRKQETRNPQDMLGLLLAPALPWRGSACQLCMRHGRKSRATITSSSGLDKQCGAQQL